MTLEKLERQRQQSNAANRVRRQDPEYRAQRNAQNLALYHAGSSGNVAAVAAISKETIHEIACPCCKQPVRVPSLEIVVDHYGVTPLEARILGAVWKGKGMPVQTERIFDAMYEDDADGGPSPPRMYQAIKVALCHMRARLKGSGVSIENVGYRRGYRLVLGE